MKNFIKCLFFIFLYIAATILMAYIVLAQTIPDDGQCHIVDGPLLVHYILAMIITALLTLVLVYSKNNKPNKNNKNDR